MHRTTAAGNAGNLFTNGDPGSGIEATTIDADDQNAHQEELANLIEGAAITLNPADNTQALQAVRALVQKHGEWHTFVLPSPWVNYSGAEGFRPSLSMRQLSTGMVVVEGVLKTATNPGANSPITTAMDSIYRPEYTIDLPLMRGVWSGGQQSVGLRLGANGVLYMLPSPGAAVDLLVVQFSYMPGSV